MAAPLAGVRVVDLTRYVAGPLTAMTLGDLGADVIKVETPTGDPARESGPFVGGESAYYMASNHSKRGVALDLRDLRGMELLLKLIDTADVFIENFRPGTAIAMGLGPEALHARNPRLIHVSITGFGNTGAARDLPSFDQTVQAMSGLMSVTGTEETGPMRVGIAVADAASGAFATVGVFAALLERERTGRGTMVEASLMQSAMAIINYQAQNTVSTGVAPGRHGNDHLIMFPQGTFRVGSSAITIASGNEKMWRKLCAALDLDRWRRTRAMPTTPAACGTPHHRGRPRDSFRRRVDRDHQRSRRARRPRARPARGARPPDYAGPRAGAAGRPPAHRAHGRSRQGRDRRRRPAPHRTARAPARRA